jgi:hypothetical protein
MSDRATQRSPASQKRRVNVSKDIREVVRVTGLLQDVALTSGFFDAEFRSPLEAQIVVLDLVSFEVDTFSMESEPDGIAIGREKDPSNLFRDEIVQLEWHSFGSR